MPRKKNNAISIDTIEKVVENELDYYSIKPIDETGATIKIIVGTRSNGKSYAVLVKAVESFAKDGITTVFCRRWRSDATATDLGTMFSKLVKNGVIEKATGGKWHDVFYWSNCWYFCNYDESGNRERHSSPFMYFKAINEAERGKSSWSDPNCKRIIFEEFLATADKYIPDEWKKFITVYSSVKRDLPDDQFECYMIGNTLNPMSLYFMNMGIHHIEKQEKGTIQLYNFPGRFKMAVELTREKGPSKSNLVDGFFYAFDDPTIRMTRDGDWEFEQFPLMKEGDIGESFDIITAKNCIFDFYVEYDDYLLKNIIVKDTKGIYVLSHLTNYKLTDKDYNTKLIYRCEPSIRPNIRDTFQKPRDAVDQEINRLFALNLFRYNDNWAGNVMKNFLSEFTK